ncbi:MAG: HprK-related kinase A [Burkholderiaceae bacterium]|nr:HprK-related kinase A [Burkholderiaceae bacterium]
MQSKLIADLPQGELRQLLRRDGVHLVTGAFTVRLTIDWAPLVPEFAEMYGGYRLEDPPGIDDAHVHIGPPSIWRRLISPIVVARADNSTLIEPVPAERAFTALESCLNWGVATAGIAPIIMHSAVLERHGRALLMPAPSGSGKSTLAAAMCFQGWRLLSDEMAVFDFDRHQVLPNPRPVSLKNSSIELVRTFAPQAVLTRVFSGTPKGDIAYMRVPQESVDLASVPATPAVVLIPSWRAGAPVRLQRISRGDAFRWLIESTVNYASMLDRGFDLLADIVKRCGLYSLEYSSTRDAIRLLDRLIESPELPDA